MKLFEWTVESLSLPGGIVRMKNAGDQVQKAMDCSDIVANSIRYAIKKHMLEMIKNRPIIWTVSLRRLRTVTGLLSSRCLWNGT